VYEIGHCASFLVSLSFCRRQTVVSSPGPTPFRRLGFCDNSRHRRTFTDGAGGLTGTICISASLKSFRITVTRSKDNSPWSGGALNRVAADRAGLGRQASSAPNRSAQSFTHTALLAHAALRNFAAGCAGACFASWRGAGLCSCGLGVWTASGLERH